MKCEFNNLHINLIEITLHHGCSPVNLLRIFRTPFHRNTSGELLLEHLFSRNTSQWLLSNLKNNEQMKNRTHGIPMYI